MKYQSKEAFEAANKFGTGTPNTAYAQFFIGDSFLNPLTAPKAACLSPTSPLSRAAATTGISTTPPRAAVSC